MKKKKNTLRVICLGFILLMVSCCEPTKADCHYVMGETTTTLTADENTELFKPGTKLRFVKLREVCE